jgi:hypothetical protein
MILPICMENRKMILSGWKDLKYEVTPTFEISIWKYQFERGEFRLFEISEKSC